MPIQTDTLGAPLDIALRRAFSSFPTGVVAVCAVGDDGAPVGMAVNSFTSISLDPPMAAISVARTSRTWSALSSRPFLGLSVLGRDQEAVSRRLSARDGDRFEGAAWQADDAGAIHLDGAALWLTCTVLQEVDGGDHTIVLLAIDGLEHFPEVEPLLFHQSRYRTFGQ